MLKIKRLCRQSFLLPLMQCSCDEKTTVLLHGACQLSFPATFLLFSLCAASKLSRQVGVCWLTRGPGELNHSLSLEPEHLRFCCYQRKDSCLKTPSHTLYLLPLLSQNYRRDSCSYPTSHFSVLGDHAGVISLEIDPCVLSFCRQ